MTHLEMRDQVRGMFAKDWRIPLLSGLIKIKTKAMELVPLKPNKVQRRLIDLIWSLEKQGIPVRIVIPKSRQHGISTITEAIIYCKTAFQHNMNAIIVADTGEHASNIFEMSQLMHEQMSDLVRTETKKSNAFELSFRESHSKIEIGTTGRSGTYHIFHSSETAFYKNCDKTMLGVLQTVPDLPGTMVIMESTGNGIGNYFHQRCLDAKAGRIKDILFFIPWFENEDNVMPADPDMILQADGEFGNEIWYRDEYNLTMEQLAWRRFAISDKCGGDLHQFMQEFPANLEECFQGSGYPVFDHVKLMTMETHGCRMPRWTGIIDGNVIDLGKDRKGWLQVWEKPDTVKWNNRYCIGADTGGTSEGADYSHAYVFDRLKRCVVACIHGHFDAYIYAGYLVTIAKWYQNAKLAVESNKWDSETDDLGIAVIDNITKRHKYRNFYTRKVRDDQTNTETTRIGWHTNVETKPLIVDRLRRFVNEWENEKTGFQDRELLQEMRTYIVESTNQGKTTWNAAKGNKDDRVMSYGITLCVSDEMPVPTPFIMEYKTNSTNDPIEAII